MRTATAFVLAIGCFLALAAVMNSGSTAAGSAPAILHQSETYTYSVYFPLVLKDYPTWNGTVEIVDHRAISATRIVVLLQNRGVTATLVRLEATVTYPDGSTGRGTGYPYLSVIQPGEYACARIVPIPVGGWTTYTVRITTIITDPTASRAVPDVLSTNVSFNHVTGTIQNNASQTASYVKAVATLYDSTGRILNCGYDMADPPVLAPGATASYDVYFTDNPAPPAGAVVQTDGY